MCSSFLTVMHTNLSYNGGLSGPETSSGHALSTCLCARGCGFYFFQRFTGYPASGSAMTVTHGHYIKDLTPSPHQMSVSCPLRLPDLNSYLHSGWGAYKTACSGPPRVDRSAGHGSIQYAPDASSNTIALFAASSLACLCYCLFTPHPPGSTSTRPVHLRPGHRGAACLPRTAQSRIRPHST